MRHASVTRGGRSGLAVALVVLVVGSACGDDEPSAEFQQYQEEPVWEAPELAWRDALNRDDLTYTALSIR